MEELESRFVKLGVWTDWEKGRILGKTITTDSQTGAMVVAILAVLAVVGK